MSSSSSHASSPSSPCAAATRRATAAGSSASIGTRRVAGSVWDAATRIAASGAPASLIDHARAANVPILVAINKIDKPDAKPDEVKKQLADYGLLPDLSQTNPDHDIVFTWNGTTSGVKVANGDWISNDAVNIKWVVHSSMRL